MVVAISPVVPKSGLRRLLTWSGWLVIALSLAWVGWSRGRGGFAAKKDSQTSETTSWIVSGSSMVPTLRGPSRTAICSSCKLDWVVDIAASEIAPERLLCAHCGGTMKLSDRGSGQNRIAGDVVDVHGIDSAITWRRGDLVAVRHEGPAEPFVKRVIGLPGDTIGLDVDGMHLLLNGRRIEDELVGQRGRASLPQFMVDCDDARSISRWSPPAGDRSWTRDTSRRWMAQQSETNWLLYGHQSVYDQNRPSGVLDDYPYNVAVARMLQPVDRFSLSGRCECVGKARIEVAFWSADTAMIGSLDINGNQPFETSYYQAVTGERLPVNAQQPVAIRVTGDAVTLSSLVIKRWVEYRLRPADSRARYPMKIGDHQLFILGDNVPVSVDSRDFGPVSMTSLLGRVTKRPSAEPR